jgi:L-threonylcarbamoyladenylate synthase
MIVSDIEIAANLLRQDQLVGIPTETVYGLAANALKPEAVVRIFEAKNRPFFDPLIVHIANARLIESYAKDIHNKAWKLAETFWPGPLTLVLPRMPIIPDIVTSGMETVGLRVPQHPVTQKLLEILDFPLAAPSANPFGYISPTIAQHVESQLHDKIAGVLDGGPCVVGVESTIVQVSVSGELTLLRQGGTSLEALRDCIGEIDVQAQSSSNPLAPGMLASHYAPTTPLRIGNIQDLKNSLGNKKLAYISLMDSWQEFPGVRLSEGGSLNEAARNLFAAMRELDHQGFDLIIAEKMPDIGIGRAINDRLFRASTK